jgi:hypothetical protein
MVKSDVWNFSSNQQVNPQYAICAKKNITREKATIQRNENTSHLWRHLEEFHSNDDVSLLLSFLFCLSS